MKFIKYLCLINITFLKNILFYKIKKSKNLFNKV